MNLILLRFKVANLAVYFKNSSNGILPSPRGARLGCGWAKMSGFAAHTDNFKFFFGGIQIRACGARTK